MWRRFVAVAGIVALGAVLLAAGAQQDPTPVGDEAATARRMAAIRSQPLLLKVFLHDLPKGGDLHNHLSGAVYAESFLRWAADDNLCLIVATMSLAGGSCDNDGRPTAASVLQTPALYNQAIDAMSMRNWDPALNGHDHFFAAFTKFGPPGTKTGDMLAEVTARAAAEHVSYLELMLTPVTGATTTQFARDARWNPNLAQLRDRLLSAGFRATIFDEARRRLKAAEDRRREVLRCGSGQEDRGCGVEVRYIAQAGRTVVPEQVFAQMLAGFELAAEKQSGIVGLNLVQPEDDPTAVRDFGLHMSMLHFLHGQYPNVPITLHAGELTEGLVPPEALTSHIRQSVETGHAQRIGHGVDVMSEDDPFGLLRSLAARRVMIEAALTSNDVILGVKGARHPLRLYLQYGVPVALVTDDAGVSRSTHSAEFQKAVEEHNLDYPTLKQLARNSLRYAFVEAATKTRLQGDLERAFRAFERQQTTPPRPAVDVPERGGGDRAR